MDESVAVGMRLMGIPEEQIQAELAKAKKDKDNPAFDFEVYEDCWRSVMLFLRVQTQWLWKVHSRPAGFGSLVWSVRTGLNYSGVESALRMGGLRRSEWPGLLDDLQVMEAAVLEAESQAAVR